MSIQDIIIVQEFNSWRRGDVDLSCNEGYPKRLGIALDEVVKAAERYEFIRTLAPVEYKELWMKNLQGGVTFDDLVDSMIKARKS